MAKRKKHKLFWLLMLFFAALGGAGWYTYSLLFSRALTLPKDEVAIYIHTGWTEKDVLAYLQENKLLRHPKLLEAVMEKKNYTGNLVVPGKYLIQRDMNAPDLIDHLRAGNGEVEVKVRFNTARTLADIAGMVSKTIEADSISLMNVFTSTATMERLGFNAVSFTTMFLPDTYQMEWDTNPDEFLDRMAEEYKSFWGSGRKNRAEAIGLSQSEATTLASIVQAEQQVYPEEQPIIAGLYLNRIRKGMKLQSDPTVIFAIGDFKMNRVLKQHLITPSPYNTYVNVGLPPGPINIPSKRAIDAVLFPSEHQYIYMCAKADFSGYHAFAENLIDHNKNARAFQKALNERRIYK